MRINTTTVATTASTTTTTTKNVISYKNMPISILTNI